MRDTKGFHFDTGIHFACCAVCQNCCIHLLKFTHPRRMSFNHLAPGEIQNSYGSNFDELQQTTRLGYTSVKNLENHASTSTLSDKSMHFKGTFKSSYGCTAYAQQKAAIYSEECGSTSRTAAAPMPVPMHIDTTPYRFFVLCIS